MSVYAIADLHGQYGLWQQVKEFLGEDDVLYILGDCADRGSDGWKIIKEALADPRVIYLRGNHEQMLLDCWRYDWCDNYLWYCNGGEETFNALLMDVNYEICLQELSKTKLWESYVNTSGKKIFLSHAGWTLMQDDEIPDKEDLLWDRSHINDYCDWWLEETYMVHGHTPVTTGRFKVAPTGKINENETMIKYCHDHKICIDACSAYSNKIGLLNLDTLEIEKEFYNGK